MGRDTGVAITGPGSVPGGSPFRRAVRRLPADPGGPGGSGQGPPASRPRDLAPLLFGLEVADDGPVSVVRLSGELDVASRDQVRDQLTSLTSPTVAVDIETLTFLDASGLSALLAAKRAIESRGGSWSLKGARGIVRRVISMADLTQELGMSA